MPRNYLRGSSESYFRPADGSPVIPLHRYMQGVQDRISVRVAMHEFLKVDGGEAELMGRAPREYKFNLCIVDSDSVIGDSAGEWREIYYNIVAQIEASPKGTLIHPVFGGIRVVCKGIDGGAIDINTSINSVNVPITFVDDSVDTRFTPYDVKSTSSLVSEIFAAIEKLATASLPFTTAAVAVSVLTSSATTYADALQLANDDTTADPSLDTQLGTVVNDALLAIIAIEADPANDKPTTATDAVGACEVLSATSMLGLASLRDSRPALTAYVVGADTNLLALAAILYGPAATQRLEELAQLNPGLPYLLAAGTVLRLSTPTLV